MPRIFNFFKHRKTPFPDTKPNLVLVHLGESWFSYINDCLAQALKFNSGKRIWVVASSENRTQCTFAEEVNWVDLQSLEFSKAHVRFRKNTKLDSDFRGGFWKFATERFFIIEEVMAKYDLSECFHIENDNSIYVDLTDLLPIFRAQSGEIAAPFDNDERCIPSFMFFKSLEGIQKLNVFLSKASARSSLNDMQTLALYRKKFPKQMYSLPIVPEGYTCNWTTPSGLVSKNPKLFFNLSREFKSVFDAAAIGQYLGGTHPDPGIKKFVNESSVFNPSSVKFEWLPDEQGRSVPFINFESRRTKIINLHIHSKNLREFTS